MTHHNIEVNLTTLNLPVTVLKHLDGYKTRYVTRTDIILEAIEDWLDKKCPDTIARTTPIKQTSAWLVGRQDAA